MVNKVVLVGRSTKAFELKTTTSGKYLCDFTLAVDKFREGANFINCQVWGKSAEYLTKYGIKGSIVVVDGTIETNNYQDKEGKTVYKTYVLANQIKLIGGKTVAQQEGAEDGTDPFAPQTSVENTNDDPFVTSDKSLASKEDFPF